MSSQMQSEKDEKISLLAKFYICSLIFEPLLYFTMASGGQATGIPLSLSRILQIIVVAGFLSKVLRARGPFLTYQLSFFKFNRHFLYYIFSMLVASMLGIFLFRSYEINIHSNLFASTGEADVPFLKSRYIRPFFDVFLLLYYYFYFIILSTYFINTVSALRYFFIFFIRILYLVLLFGFLDLLFAFFTGSALIKRHFGEATDVGFRFHSFAGEPRDAFVYLVFASCVLVIYQTLFQGIKNSKLLLYLLLLALILTQSASGILGIFIGGVLALSYFLGKLNKKAFYFLGIFLCLIWIIAMLIPYSPRMQLYIDGFGGLYDNLKSGAELPYILLVQSVNFLPFWGMFNQILQFNFIQFFLGSGFSTAAYYNMNFIGDYSYSNPNSQITRILFEGGIIGFVLYLAFLTKPVLSFFNTFLVKEKHNAIFIFFLLTGSALAHRSQTPFILLGLIMSLRNINLSNKVSKN